MLLDQLLSTVIFEQPPGPPMQGPVAQQPPEMTPAQDPRQQMSPEEEQQMAMQQQAATEEQAPGAEPPEIEPLKKYYLVSKLRDLHKKLKDNDIHSEALGTILLFANELPYGTLMALSQNLLKDMDKEVKRSQQDDKKK